MKNIKQRLRGIAALVLVACVCCGFLVSCDGFDFGSSSGGDTDEIISSFDLEKLAMIEKLYKENFVGEIDYDKMTDALINAYIAAAGDEFGTYFNTEDYKEYNEGMSAEFSGIGVNVIFNAEYNAIEIVNVFQNSPADKGGITVGDLIITVGEEKTPISELGYDIGIANLRGESGTEAKFEVLRGEGYTERLSFSIVREKIIAESVFYKMLESGEKIGYIRIDQFDAKTDEAFIAAVDTLKTSGATAFVFDVRNNPGGYLSSVLSMLDYILPEGPIARIDFYGDGEYEQTYTSDAEHFLDAPMVVIANQSTASAGELFTSAIHDYAEKGMISAVTVGMKTFGKGTMQHGYALEDGSYINITVAYYDPPYTANYHGKGLKPDFEVELSETAKKTNLFKLAEKDDAQLLEAVKQVELLRKK